MRRLLISFHSMAAICVLRAKGSLSSSGSLYRNGLGKDEGWLYTKPPCLHESFKAVAKFLLRCKFISLTHFLTYSSIYPRVPEQLPCVRCCVGPWVYNGACNPVSTHSDGQRKDRREAASLAWASAKQYHCLLTPAVFKPCKLKEQ